MKTLKTIEKNLSYEIVEKKSKFIANAFYVETVSKAEEIIKTTKKKYHDAKHNCYAYITIDEEQNIIQKCSDDGEPSGTAGTPILSILQGKELLNTLVIVTRYFGGILLGTGGLVRAYSKATLEVLEKNTYIEIEKGKTIKITLQYSEIEAFRYYCKKRGIRIIKEEYLDNVEFFIEISNEMLDIINTNSDKLCFKMTKVDILNEKYIKRNIGI